MEENELRQCAKSLGIKSWHVKSQETLIYEINEIESANADSAFNATVALRSEVAESAIAESVIDDGDAAVRATYHNGYQAWLTATEANKLIKEGIVVSYERA